MKVKCCLNSFILSALLFPAFYNVEGREMYGREKSYGQMGASTYSSSSKSISSYEPASKSAEDIEKADMHPFVLATGKIIDDDVVGLRITNDNLFILGSDKTYNKEQLSKNSEFEEFDFFSKYPNLITVDFNNISFSKKKLENLQKFLPRTLKNIILNKCKISKKDYAELVDVLLLNENLIAITLIQPECELAESTKLAETISQLKNLEAANITLGQIGEQALEGLTTMLKASSDTLESLKLGFRSVENCPEYENFLSTLGELKNLKEFEFASLDTNEEQLNLFFESLQNLSSLQRLKFYFDDFAKHDHVKSYHNSVVFRDALIKMQDLEALDISYMEIPLASMQMLSQALPQLPKLKSLNISGNTLDVETAKDISNAIKDCSELTTLFANQCGMTSEIFSSLCNNLGSTGLKYLYFRGNSIKDGAKSLPIQQMKYAVVIDFSQNDITYDSALDFVYLTQDHPSLHIVNFHNNVPILKLSSQERSAKNDILVKWKINHLGRANQISFFGL